MTLRRRNLALVGLLLAAVLVACGGGGGTSDTSAGTKYEGALGAPGDPAQSARTITITAGDTLKFTPDTVQVKVGETVVFKVVNAASIMHDFTLGDQKMQDEHEAEMRAMTDPNMSMGDEPNAIHIAPGATKQLVWKFDKKGTTLFGCHEPGHYAAGMRGTVTVS